MTTYGRNIARGDGEYLTSLGTLLNVAPGDLDEFGAFVQSKYHALFASDLTTDRTAHLTMLAALTANGKPTKTAGRGPGKEALDLGIGTEEQEPEKHLHGT